MPREKLVMAQTPQVCPLRSSARFESARLDGFHRHRRNSMVERLDVEVSVGLVAIAISDHQAQ
jgi:hypothetical protein